MEAVYLLNTVVDQCTGEIFSQHSEYWVKTLLKILQVLFFRHLKYLLFFHATGKCIIMLYEKKYYMKCYTKRI